MKKENESEKSGYTYWEGELCVADVSEISELLKKRQGVHEQYC